MAGLITMAITLRFASNRGSSREWLMKDLFNDAFDPADEWVDMPEFIQEKRDAFKTITVRFECEEDYLEFAEIINQKLTSKTKSIWHPFKPHRRGYRKVWK
jgi:hypothetical protein